jgi:bifunctional DNA-binding transcriptional regulator/antitoxin component of YhaV-PrlF toxin-antitoxin module
LPQLVKGGKFIYGLSRVGPDGSIAIPPQAMQEYGFRPGDDIIIMSGSRRSGGFGLTRQDIIEKSSLAHIIDTLPYLFDHLVAEFEIVNDKARLYCWTTIQNDGRIVVPSNTLSRYGINTGELLAAGRGSRLSIAFIAKGPIMEECLRHPELEVI